MTQAWYQYPITHGFYPSYNAQIADTPHFAVDIGTPFHTPITAILPGVVKQADYTAWGGEIFIQPDDSKYPEYYIYHPDRLEVSAGQHVNAGQEIALSGGENPGYPGAEHPALPIWSTGPHTHVGWFTGWTNTPIGTRPQGPDITGFIQNLATGKTVLPPSTSAGDSTSNAEQSNLQAQAHDALVHIALFMVALFLLAFGFYVLFRKQIVSSANSIKRMALETVVA